MRKPRPSPPPAPEPDDAELFRSAVGPVRELPAPPEPPRAPPPRPVPRQRQIDEARALEDSRLHPFDFADGFGDSVEYLRDGVQAPLAWDALELVRSTLGELDARADHQIVDRAGDEDASVSHGRHDPGRR